MLTHYNRTLKPHSNRPLYSNTVIGTLAVDRWAVTFGTARRAWAGLDPAQSPPRCTKCNSPPINAKCTNCTLFDVALYLSLDSKGLNMNTPYTFYYLLGRSEVLYSAESVCLKPLLFFRLSSTAIINTLCRLIYIPLVMCILPF